MVDDIENRYVKKVKKDIKLVGIEQRKLIASSRMRLFKVSR